MGFNKVASSSRANTQRCYKKEIKQKVCGRKRKAQG